MRRTIVFVLTTLALALGLTACASSPATQEPTRSEHEIIKDAIVYHGCYGEEADAKVAELLAELSAQDKRQGELWTNIMDYWTYVNTGLEVHTDALPADLPADDSMCIVILGFELNPDGSMKDELIGRLNVGLACAQQYPNAYVICTGGGTAKDNPDATEGGMMGAWLLEHGLDEKRLIVEDRSHTTAENASFSYQILCADYPQVNSVAIVSSSYHIGWGSLLFESTFLIAASENGTPEMHVISNCGYPIVNDNYKESEILRWQTGGMLQLIGENELAMQFYRDYDNVEKPAL